MYQFKRILIVLLIITLFPVTSFISYGDDNTSQVTGQKLSNLGILVGSDGDLRLNDSLNRYEGLILAIRIVGKESIAKAFDTSNLDAIVSEEVPNWAKHYVQYSLQGDLNITKGIGKDESGKIIFGGDSKLTALQFATFILNASGYEVPDWKASLNQLVELNIIENSDILYLLEGTFTRRKASFLIDKILLNMKLNGGKSIIDNLIDVEFTTRSIANTNGYGNELSIINVGLNSFNIISTKELNIFSAEHKSNYSIIVDGNKLGQSDFTLELQEDQKTVFLDINSKVKQSSTVQIMINNMMDESNTLLKNIEYSEIIVDNFAPKIVSSEWMDSNTILVKFNEKIKSNNINAYIDSKKVVSMIQTSEREIFMLLHNSLVEGQKYDIKLDYVYDTVGYKTNLSTTLIPERKDLEISIRNITTNGYDVVFNQRIKDNFGQLISDVYTTDYRKMFSLSFPNNHPIEVSTLDGFRIKIKYKDLIPFGTANFFVLPEYDNKHLVDGFGNNIIEEYREKTYLPIDNIAPVVTSISKVDDNHLLISIDEATINSTTLANYSLIDSNANTIAVSQVEKVNETTLILTTSDLANKEVALSISSLTDVYGNKSSLQIVTLSGSLSKDAPTIFTTGYYSDDQFKVEIRFSKEMNESILNPSNYLFDGRPLSGISIQGFEKNKKVLLTLPDKLSNVSIDNKIVVKKVEDAYNNQSKYDLTTVLCIPGTITKQDLSDVAIYALDNQNIIFETSYQISSANKNFIYFTNINVDEVSFGYTDSKSILGFKTSKSFANDLSNLGGYLFFDIGAIKNPLGSENKSSIRFDNTLFADRIPPTVTNVEKLSPTQIRVTMSEPIVPVSATHDKFIINGLSVTNVSVSSSIIDIYFDGTITGNSIFIKQGIYDSNNNKLSSSQLFDF